MIKDNTQVLQLAILHKQVTELSNREFTSIEWEKEAIQVISKIVPLVPSCVTSEFCFLEPFAKLVAKSCPKETFQPYFLHLLLLHLFNSNLYPILTSPGKIEQLQKILAAIENVSEVPGSAVQLVSPFDYFFDLKRFAETNRSQTTVLLVSLAQIHQIMKLLHETSSPSWQIFGEIMRYMSQSKGHRDLVTLMFFHDEKSVALVHRSSLLASSGLVQKYCQLIMEMLLLRPSLVATYSMLKALQGASRLIPIYPPQQHAAFEIAHNVPFRFILDLLNHSHTKIDFVNKTIVACASIASQRMLLLSASKQRLYSEFNSVSSVRSLYYVMTQFGCVVAHINLQRNGCGSVAKSLFKLLDPRASALPPTSKPNYFFAEKKLVNEDETVVMMQTMEEFNDLQLTLSLILKSVGRAITDELQQVLDLSDSREFTEKMVVRNLQHTFTFLLAAKRCNNACEEASFVTKDIDGSILQIIRKMFQVLEKHASLVWVTLYNFANDLCYAEISMVPTVSEFLKQIIEKQNDESQAALINSGIRVFSETFGDLTPKCDEENEGWVEIPRSEYAFLYKKSPVLTNYSEEKTVKQNQSNSGRQQSVHVDKYKK